MPSMANITVKNKAGTDVIYVAKVASAGDKTPAKWSLDAASAVPNHRPTLVIGTRGSTNGNARILDINYAYPIVVPINGVDTVVGKFTFQGNSSINQSYNSSFSEEGAVQVGNLLVSSLVRAIFTDGYAPT